MGLFGRRRGSSTPAKQSEESRFAAEARALGWEPADESAFVRLVDLSVYESARVLYGQGPHETEDHVHSYGTHYHDLFRATVNGRRVFVANGAQNIVPHLFDSAQEVKTFSVCVAELPSVYAVVSIAPRHVPQPVHLMAEYKTGNAEFDAAYRVNVSPLGEPAVTPEMQRLILARDNWAFRSVAGAFVCTQKDAYEFIDDMQARIAEVLAIVAAIPESVLPSRVDHSADDLLARIDKLESVEDAIAFLQQLTPADRERLASSPTPLAEFADVETPEAAIERFESLSQQRRLEIITMFSRVSDD
jgi:hypothetical protein